MGEAATMDVVVRKIEPARGYAVVRPHAKPERTKGGILLAPPSTFGGVDPHREQVEFTGEVVAMGKGRVTSNGDEMPSGFEAGDEVFFVGNSSAIQFEAALEDGPKHAETGEPRQEKLYLIDQDFICAKVTRVE